MLMSSYSAEDSPTTRHHPPKCQWYRGGSSPSEEEASGMQAWPGLRTHLCSVPWLAGFLCSLFHLQCPFTTEISPGGRWMVRWPVLRTQFSGVGSSPVGEAEIHSHAGAIEDVCGSFLLSFQLSWQCRRSLALFTFPYFACTFLHSWARMVKSSAFSRRYYII